MQASCASWRERVHVRVRVRAFTCAQPRETANLARCAGSCCVLKAGWCGKGVAVVAGSSVLKILCPPARATRPRRWRRANGSRASCDAGESPSPRLVQRAGRAVVCRGDPARSDREQARS